MEIFVCKGCVNPVTGTGCTSIDIGVSANITPPNDTCYTVYYSRVKFNGLCGSLGDSSQ